MSQRVFDHAQLALAAYGVLEDGETRLQTPALQLADFTERQSQEFARDYPFVIAQFNDGLAEGGGGTGLSVAMFRDAEGNLSLAIRGTDSLAPIGGSDFAAGTDIVGNGAAYDQIIALANWWRRVSAPQGTQVVQHRIGTYAANAVPADAVVLDIGDMVRVVEEAPPVLVQGGPIAEAVAADTGRRIDVIGHSLGGHLSMAFAALFPGVTGAVTVFNAPGFQGTATNQAFFAKLGGSLPVHSEGIINVAANEALIDRAALNLVAGMHSRPGVHVDVAIENQSASDEPAPFGARNHSMVILADSLAVYRLLSDLSPSLTPEAYRLILNRAERFSHAGYERIVESLATLLTGQAASIPTGNDQRNALYTAIQTLRAQPLYSNRIGLLEIQATPDMAAALVAEAAASTDRGLAHRYALVELTPFVVIDAANLGVYSRFKSGGAQANELDPFDAVTNRQGLTRQYLEDRAAFLERKLYITGQDRDFHYQVRGSTEPLPNPPDARGQAYQSEQKHYEDRASGFIASRGDNPNVMQHFVFGGPTTDMLSGGGRNDHLYGGKGADTLTGGKGDDYLEGGKGSDSYIYASGDGFDTIFDSDGLGSIRINGVTLAGAVSRGDGRSYKWTDSSGKDHSYVFLTGDAATGGDLLVDGRIAVKHFRSGDLGIHLHPVEEPATPQTTITIDASLKPKLFHRGYVQGEPGVLTVPLSSNPTHLLPNGPIEEGWLRANFPQYTSQYGVTTHDSAFGPAGRVVILDFQPVMGTDENGDPVLIGGETTYVLIDTNAPLQTSYSFIADAGGAVGDGRPFNTPQNDRIIGGETADVVASTNSNLAGGNDFIETKGGDDHVQEGNGDDVIAGGDGSDSLWGGRGGDRLYAKDRIDLSQAIINGNTQTGSGGIEYLMADDTSYLIGSVVTNGDDWVVGDASNDVILGGGGSDILIGGAGDDDISGDNNFNWWDTALTDPNYPIRSFRAESFGGTYHNVVAGYQYLDVPLDGAADSIYAGNGNDVVWGGAGDDVIFGEGDSDRLTGDDGDDRIFGGGGNDYMWGDGGMFPHLFTTVQNIGDTRGLTTDVPGRYSALVPGHDYLDGGDGDDVIYGGGGAYWYGKNGSFAGIGLQSAEQVLGGAGFGSDAQTLRPFNGLQEGFSKLS